MAKAGSDQEGTGNSDQPKMEDAGSAAPADTEMPDAPANQPSEEKASEQISPEPQAQPQAEAQPEERKEEPATNAAAATDAPTEPPAETTPPQPAAESAPPDAKPDAEADTKADTVMADSQEQAQPTAASEAPSAAPAGDATASPTTKPHPDTADAPAGTPPPPAAAAEKSTSEVSQPSTTTKVSRERDVDSEDEPVAKRTKVEHAREQVEVKTGSGQPQDQDRMDVDQQQAGGAASDAPVQDSGEPKNLADDSLNDKPITEWQNKQIRTVLAGVKKTKVGLGFRQPVRDLWPHLWNEYSARISNPVDISLMEKRLRGEVSPYTTMGEFKADLDLMVQNSITFNGELHDVTLAAKACRESILTRMAAYPAVEPAKPEKKDSKAHATRHVDSRSGGSGSSAGRPKGASPSSQKPVVESPAFAIPANNNGVPLIRRDSSKPDSRAKRPVKPAHPKDLVYDTKRKKKLPLELRFCDEVLTELRKTKHYDVNAPFLQPVDPVALNIPTYHKIIKKPMDLQTMADKLSAGEYTTAKEFEKDFDLIIKNCRTFNGDDHAVYHQALRLQDLYRAEMSKKDEWMAKHAPPSAAATAATTHAASSPHPRDDSDDSDADSEGDAEREEEHRQLQQRLATIQKRLEEEQRKVDAMVNSGTAEIADVEIGQSVVAMLQKQLMQERAKLAQLPPLKKSGKSKGAKSKKAGGAAMAGKKASMAGPSGGAGGAAKKSGTKKSAPKRKIGQLEKEMIIESLGELNGAPLERAIDLIKKDTGQGENDSGELELDIESLSEEALGKLYDIVNKAFPHLRAEKERAYAQAAAAAAEPAARPKPTKSKKNKPMSKLEQERRIQQLNELRAQAGRQASGSQEPLESIEGNGNEPAAQPEPESEDEVSSEEE